MYQERDRIRQVEHPVAVPVEEASSRETEASRLAGEDGRLAPEEMAQEADAIGEVELAVLVAVPRKLGAVLPTGARGHLDRVGLRALLEDHVARRADVEEIGPRREVAEEGPRFVALAEQVEPGGDIARGRESSEEERTRRALAHADRGAAAGDIESPDVEDGREEVAVILGERSGCRLTARDAPRDAAGLAECGPPAGERDRVAPGRPRSEARDHDPVLARLEQGAQAEAARQKGETGYASLPEDPEEHVHAGARGDPHIPHGRQVQLVDVVDEAVGVRAVGRAEVAAQRAVLGAGRGG